MKFLDKIDDAIVAYSQKVLIARSNQEEQTRRQFNDYNFPPQTAIKLNTMGTISAGQFGAQKMSVPRPDFNRENKSLNFTLHPAEGGYILELSHYNENNDRYHQRLHLINDTDDMGESISKIITLELLRR